MLAIRVLTLAATLVVATSVAIGQKPRVISGEYMETVACYLDQGIEEIRYTLTLSTGAVLQLSFREGVKHPKPGAWVKLRGILRDQHCEVLEVVDEVMPENGNTTPIGEQKILVLLINFQDAPTQNTTPAIVWDQFMNPISSVNRWFQETSFGKMWIDVDVFGWFTLPINRSCDPNTWRTHAIQAVSPYVTFANYNRLFILVPGGGGCSWGGLGTLGFETLSTPQGPWVTTTSWCRSEYYNDNRLAIAISTHEGGHNLGQHHASSRAYSGETLGSFDTNGAGGTMDEYGDRFDTLGSWNLGAYNARHKSNLGWFDPGHVVTVTKSGFYTLSPYTLYSSAPKALKVFRGYGPNTGRSEFVYFEWRRPIGYDTDINYNNGINYTGALAHFHWNNSSTRTHLLDFTLHNNFLDAALQVGRTWNDNYRPISVRVVSIVGNTMTLEVNIGFNGVVRQPTSYTIFRGSHVSGGLSDVLSSDNNYLVIREVPLFAAGESEVMVVFNGTSHVSNPAVIGFRLEANVTSGGVRKMVELWNWSTNRWVATDYRPATVGTDSIQVYAEENLSGFVQSGTNAIRARVRFDGQSAFAFGWQARIDQAVWEIFPRS